MFTTSDIPNYEEDIRRLMKTEQIDFGKAINDMLRSIFNIYIPEGVLTFIQILMWVALICFICWILYKEFWGYYQKPTVESIDTEIFTSTEMGVAEDADIRGHNFVQELQKAVAEEDFALAVHLRYLMALQRLDIKKLIQWAPNKTPMMYVREITEGSDKLKEMTMTFLYIKYGHYPANQEVLNEVTSLYDDLCSLKEGGKNE